MTAARKTPDALCAALAAGDDATVKLLLHPYLHWTEGPVQLRGRTNVLAHLAGHRSLPAPETVELRDGQIYRWTVSGPEPTTTPCAPQPRRELCRRAASRPWAPEARPELVDGPIPALSPHTRPELVEGCSHTPPAVVM